MKYTKIQQDCNHFVVIIMTSIQNLPWCYKVIQSECPNWISRILPQFVISKLISIINNFVLKIEKSQFWRSTSVFRNKWLSCCFHWNSEIVFFVLICGEISINTLTQPIYRFIWFSLQPNLAICSAFHSAHTVVLISCNLKEKWL